jgi:hypothetical protein
MQVIVFRVLVLIVSFEGSTQLEEMRVKGALVASGLRKV